MKNNKDSKEINCKPRASLAWKLADFLENGEEPPEFTVYGRTEGEQMSEKGVEDWAIESIKALSILKEEFPKKFRQSYQEFVLDLEYLASLGKITKAEKEDLTKKDNFNFGQEA